MGREASRGGIGIRIGKDAIDVQNLRQSAACLGVC